MVWYCQHPTCDRKVKGFPNGRKLCHVCLRCEKIFNERMEKMKGLNTRQKDGEA